MYSYLSGLPEHTNNCLHPHINEHLSLSLCRPCCSIRVPECISFLCLGSPNSARSVPHFVKLGQYSVETVPKSVDSAPKLAEIGLILSAIGRTRAEFGPFCSKFRPKSTKSGANSTDTSSTRPNLQRMRPMPAKFGTESANFGPISTDVGWTSTAFGQSRLGHDHIWPTFGRFWAGVSPTLGHRGQRDDVFSGALVDASKPTSLLLLACTHLVLHV